MENKNYLGIQFKVVYQTNFNSKKKVFCDLKFTRDGRKYKKNNFFEGVINHQLKAKKKRVYIFWQSKIGVYIKIRSFFVDF